MERNKRLEEIRAKFDRTFGNVTGQMVLTHDQIHFLLSDIDRLQGERDKAIEGLKGAISELDSLGSVAWSKWEKEADMYAQGEADAYDKAEQMVDAILEELGVSGE